MKSKTIDNLLKLQDRLNSQINANWKKAGYPYLRAAWIESAEAMDHFGWKWWKKQDSDIKQFHIELIDILHFLLSESILQDFSSKIIAMRINPVDGLKQLDPEDVRKTLESLAIAAIQGNLDDCFSALGKLIVGTGLTPEEVAELYIAKNVLNIFRQNNDYKGDSYIKDWFGQEDNQVLADVMADIDMTHPEAIEKLEAEMNRRYQLVKGANA